MLKKDKLAFLEFTSGDRSRVSAALAELSERERGHFEDHPMSRSFIRQHVPALLSLWEEDLVPGCRDWVAQFAADAGVVDERVKPLIAAALADPDCPYLPTLLYLVSTEPDLFTDTGPSLLALTSHQDREVRWRIAYVISMMRSIDDHMRRAIQCLKADDDRTTQLYVRKCEGRT